ncbi:MAG TPA: STAS domain-containing protein [Patescibacteria group bacterium]|nr:STAS domain-containing protein [Patescibacteria group bacterium]
MATTMAMSLTITVEHLEPANAHVLVCLVCAGEISLQTLATVRQSVNSLIKSDNFVKGDQLILDLSDVNFIDTSGLGALLGIKDIWSDERGRLALVINPIVKQRFEITGLDRWFEIYPNRDEALKQLAHR